MAFCVHSFVGYNITSSWKIGIGNNICRLFKYKKIGNFILKPPECKQIYSRYVPVYEVLSERIPWSRPPPPTSLFPSGEQYKTKRIFKNCIQSWIRSVFKTLVHHTRPSPRSFTVSRSLWKSSTKYCCSPCRWFRCLYSRLSTKGCPALARTSSSDRTPTTPLPTPTTTFRRRSTKFPRCALKRTVRICSVKSLRCIQGDFSFMLQRLPPKVSKTERIFNTIHDDLEFLYI